MQLLRSSCLRTVWRSAATQSETYEPQQSLTRTNGVLRKLVEIGCMTACVHPARGGCAQKRALHSEVWLILEQLLVRVFVRAQHDRLDAAQADNDHHVRDTYNYVTVQSDVKMPGRHFAYLEDGTRHAAFQRAISAAVDRVHADDTDARVLNIGCGAGPRRALPNISRVNTLKLRPGLGVPRRHVSGPELDAAGQPAQLSS